MKFHLLKCSACELKCLKTVPVLNDPYQKARNYNNGYCKTFKKDQGIKLKVAVLALNKELKPNEKCFCGSGKKFKKCHMGVI